MKRNLNFFKTLCSSSSDYPTSKDSPLIQKIQMKRKASIFSSLTAFLQSSNFSISIFIEMKVFTATRYRKQLVQSPKKFTWITSHPIMQTCSSFSKPPVKQNKSRLINVNSTLRLHWTSGPRLITTSRRLYLYLEISLNEIGKK